MQISRKKSYCQAGNVLGVVQRGLRDVSLVLRIGQALRPILGAGPRGVGHLDAVIGYPAKLNQTNREQQKNRQRLMPALPWPGRFALRHGQPSA